MGILLNIKELHRQDVSVLIFKIMELKEFIKTALIEISAALKETSDDADERGLIINPEVSHHNCFFEGFNNNQVSITVKSITNTINHKELYVKIQS